MTCDRDPQVDEPLDHASSPTGASPHEERPERADLDDEVADGRFEPL
ncbi:hypothetical protein [Thermasporomyces composti]|nr:hypothetical protein [Thermasporomyces composti]